MIPVSVYIRTKNVDKIISRVLDGVFKQKGVQLEVIIIDSESTDNTLAVCAKYNINNVVKISAKDYIPGVILNRATELCTHDIIAFVNSDAVLLNEDCLAQLIKPIVDGEASSTYGRQMARPNAHPWVRREMMACYPKDSKDKPDWMMHSAVLSAFKKSAIVERPFFTDLFGSEDTDWGYSAKKNGKPVSYVAKALCEHSHNYSLSDIYRRAFVEGESDVFIFGTTHPRSYYILRFFKQCAKDTLSCLKYFKPWLIPYAWLNRFQNTKGYLAGLKHGLSQKASQKNVGRAQELYFKNHEKSK